MEAPHTFYEPWIQLLAAHYGLSNKLTDITPFGEGLINRTWKLETAETAYILQRINTNVFPDPGAISQNIRLVGDYLAAQHPGYLFPRPIAGLGGNDMPEVAGEGFFRLFPFIPDSHTVTVVEDPQQAFEASRQFGRFTRLLRSFPIRQLQMTIPGFHDLSLRYMQFQQALEQGNKARIAQSAGLISQLQSCKFIVDEYQDISANLHFRYRVTHHDTKISNVLLNRRNEGICVIDLDTLMPGLFISDVGDMLRTYLCPVSEEEKDFGAIRVRPEIFEAVAAGYLGEMKDELSEAERAHFVYAGQFLIYMQALRFLTDHLMDDQYYGARYPDHNFIRAGNQAELLKALLARNEEFARLVKKISG